MTGENKNRLILPDVLKGLAVILMIHAHVMEQLVNPSMFDSFGGKLAQLVGIFPGAAVFMIVMGYFIGYSRATPLANMKRGVILFTGGIILNIAINISYIIRFIQNGYPELIPTAVFGVDILLLAGLSLIIIGALRKLTIHPVFWSLAALVVAGLTPWVNQIIDGWENAKYITAFIGGSAKWSYFPVFPWLAYPLTGMAVQSFGLYKWKGLGIWIKRIIILLAAIGFCSGFKMGLDVSTELSVHYHHGMVYYLWNLSFVVLILFLLDLMNLEDYPLRSAFLGFVGREVTLIYVIQWILIGNLAAWSGKQSFFVGHLAWTLVVILISVLMTWLFRIVKPGKIFNF